MRGRTAAVVFSVALLGFAGGIAVRARGVDQALASDQPLSEQERARLLATGKELFMARCARCHDERGDKPLKTGLPLNQRGLSSEQIARAVSGRPRGTTKALVTRMPARVVLRPLVHPSKRQTRRRSGVDPQIQNLDPDSARDEQARGDIGVDQRIEVVQKERVVIRRTAALQSVNYRVSASRK
jgi:hypothetical protein